jgi:general secretion pathway protein B
MSYILDALRRAESERERGSVPTLHTNPVPADRADDEEGTTSRRTGRWVWGAGVLALLLGGLAVVAAWQGGMLREPPPAPIAAPAPTIRQQAPQPASPPPVLVAAPELKLLQPAPPPQAVPATPTPPIQPDTSAPLPTPAVAATVPPLKDLPEALRRQLPALVASGAMYSDTPANRMLIINGQLLREGESVAADLVLDQIQLKNAVLSFKGQRFSISY